LLWSMTCASMPPRFRDMDTTRIRHTGIEAGIGVAAPTRAPGLRSIQEVLAPVMARLAAEMAQRRPADEFGIIRRDGLSHLLHCHPVNADGFRPGTEAAGAIAAMASGRHEILGAETDTPGEGSFGL